MSWQLLVSSQDMLKIGRQDLETISQAYTQLYPLNAQVDISLVSLRKIKSLNLSYRQIAEATDVLSFPTFATYQDIQKQPPTTPILLGSIVICPDKAVHYQESLAQLVHHGLLHLLGFDHETNLAAWNNEEERILGLLSQKHLIIPGVNDEPF